MLRRVFPFLKRPDVEFTLECASFILFCARPSCIGWRSSNQTSKFRMRMTHDLRPSPRDVPHSQNL